MADRVNAMENASISFGSIRWRSTGVLSNDCALERVFHEASRLLSIGEIDIDGGVRH